MDTAPLATTNFALFMSMRGSWPTNRSSQGVALQRPTTGKEPTTKETELRQQATPVPLDATTQRPHQARPNNQIVGTVSSSESSLKVLSETLHPAEPNPRSG